jgi:hypothetical protein
MSITMYESHDMACLFILAPESRDYTLLTAYSRKFTSIVADTTRLNFVDLLVKKQSEEEPPW